MTQCSTDISLRLWLIQTYLVEVEHQVQLTDIAEIMVQDFHKQVNALQVC